MTPEVVTKDAMVISGLHTRHRFEGFDDAVFAELWQRLRDELAAANLPVGEAIYDLFRDMFGEADAFDMVTGVVLPEETELPDGFVRMPLLRQRYAVLPHIGPREKSNETVYALWFDWLPTSGYRSVGDFQFMEVMDSDTGATTIWLPLAN